MNEQRNKELLYKREEKHNHAVKELLYAVRLFVKNNKLKGADWIVLSKMIKRLEADRDLTLKIVRVFKNRFDNIQKTYQK